MTWIPNSARRAGWLCALLLLSLFGLFGSIEPLRADDPATPPASAPPPAPGDEVSEVTRVLRDHLDASGRVVFQQAQGDLDGDGVPDLVAHVARPAPADELAPRDADAHSAIVVVLGEQSGGSAGAAVAVDIADGMLCPYCPIGEHDLTRSLPEQTLRNQDGRIEVCEAWGQSWYARECGVLRLIDGALRLERHTETSGWTRGPSEHGLAFDFVELTGQRSYLAHPVEAGWPVLERSAEFALLSAVRSGDEPVLDGELDDTAWQQVVARRFAEQRWLTGSAGEAHWTGSHDLALSVRMLWRDDALWLALEVDDDLAVRTRCEDLGTPIQADRLELWFDLARDLRASGNDESVEEHRRVYLEDPVRHGPDEQVVQLVLAPIAGGGACAARRLPRAAHAGATAEDTLDEGDARSDTADGDDVEATGDDAAPAARDTVVGAPGEVRVAVVESEDGAGYRAEVMVPASFFGVDDLREYEGRWYGLGLTVLAHDLDVAARPQASSSMATSALAWGDPFTFGVLVMPRLALELPLFPFAWSDWLE